MENAIHEAVKANDGQQVKAIADADATAVNRIAATDGQAGVPPSTSPVGTARSRWRHCCMVWVRTSKSVTRSISARHTARRDGILGWSEPLCSNLNGR